MWILHLVSAETPEHLLERFKTALRGNAGFLLHLPLRRAERAGSSILFVDRNSLDLFLSQMNGVLACDQKIQPMEFELLGHYPFNRPVIILGAPRSGTTLLFHTLAQSPDVWTIGGDSHIVIEPDLAVPGSRGHRMEAADADARTCDNIKAAFLSILRNRSGGLYPGSERSDPRAPVRILEKTPRNCLRVPFLRAIFPDCLFVFLYRNPASNIGSLIDCWHAPNKFISCYLGSRPWKFPLPPGWSDLIEKPVAEIAAAQWKACNEFVLQDLTDVPRRDWCFARYENLVSDPVREIHRICRFASLNIDEKMADFLARPLPLSNSTLTPPHPEKWRRHEGVITQVLPSLRDIEERISQIECETR